MSSSVGGQNGPVIINGGADNYDRPVAFDAPVAFDTGLVVQQPATLASLRADLMTLLGFATMIATPPPGMVTTLNLFLRLAQAQTYWRYAQLRTARWWPWQLSAGQRFYDLPVDGVDVLEPRKLIEAWIADNGGQATTPWAATSAFALGALVQPSSATGLLYKVTVAGTSGASEPAWPTVSGQTVTNGGITFTAIDPPPAVWTRLTAGINPSDFTLSTPMRPTHIEVREFIEVFPAPDKPYLLYLKAHLGLRRFTVDTDLATIDGDVLLTFAAAMAKAHYRQPDAGNYAQMAKGMSDRLTAGAHGANRYLPEPGANGMKHALAADLPMPKATFR